MGLVRVVLSLAPWISHLAWTFGRLSAALRHVWMAHLLRPLQWASKHTGVPAILLAAVAVVVLYRAAKWSGRFFAEVSLVALTLAALAKLGFLAF